MEDATASTWENQWYGAGGGDGVMISTVLNSDLRKYEGMTLTEIGRAMGKDPRDAAMDLVIADRAWGSFPRILGHYGVITGERPGRPLRGPGYRMPSNRAAAARPHSER